MIATFQKPDLVSILGQEGVELGPRGKHLWACCPLHSERTASFCVDHEKQRFKCFGCGASGDVVDFIQRYKNVSFKDALAYLGISSGDVRQFGPNPQETIRRDLVKDFHRWCDTYSKMLCEMIRLCNQIDLLVTVPEAMELKGMGEVYLSREVCEYQLLILDGVDSEGKFQLYKEVNDG